LLKFLKVNPEHVMAVGDAENDIEMIQLAGVGVAMGQAAEDVKAAADYVTSSNDADGVAEALERFVLTKPEAEKAEERAEGEAPVVIEPNDKPQAQHEQEAAS
jgi:3-deoxy-D-manno-octulosonate 8-phosphate phosphatase KdsC-like HAD superfamily phosphatase